MKVTKYGAFAFDPEAGFSIDGWEIDGHKLLDGSPTPEQVFSRMALCLDWVKYKLQLQMEESRGSC